MVRLAESLPALPKACAFSIADASENCRSKNTLLYVHMFKSVLLTVGYNVG